MRRPDCLLIPLLLLLATVRVFGQTTDPVPVPVKMMRNADVVRMVQDGVKSGVIISNILTSNCNFDIFPPVLRDLRRRGVPDTVIAAMKMAPNGPPALTEVEAKGPPAAPVTIPAGTVIEVETARATSSRNAVVDDQITFLVTRRVYVHKLLVVDRGAVARARVVKVQRARAMGRPGMLAWEMQYVVGVDGSRIPIQLSGKQVGKDRWAAIVGGGVATGAVIFPYSSPIALIWGLKKGDEAVLRGSKVYSARLAGDSQIAGLQPRPDGVVYRDQDTVKASAAPPTKTSFPRQGVRFGGNVRP